MVAVGEPRPPASLLGSGGRTPLIAVALWHEPPLTPRSGAGTGQAYAAAAIGSRSSRWDACKQMSTVPFTLRVNGEATVQARRLNKDNCAVFLLTASRGFSVEDQDADRLAESTGEVPSQNHWPQGCGGL